jgi:hypothetical protein
MCSDSWVECLRGRFADPAWTADVGAPLLVTLLGLGLALWLVRRQLRHDRELRAADRRAQALDPLARELGKAGFRLEDLSLRRTADYWSKPIWPDWGPLVGLCDDVSARLGDEPALKAVEDIISSTMRAWLLCQTARDAAVDPSDEAAHMYGTAVAMEPYAGRLTEAGRLLRRWDGTPPEPAISPSPWNRAAEQFADGEVDRMQESYRAHWQRAYDSSQMYARIRARRAGDGTGPSET